MKTLLAIFAVVILLTVVGCASGPVDRAPATIEGSTIHEQEVRDELWKDHYKDREKEAVERMDRSTGPDLSDK